VSAELFLYWRTQAQNLAGAQAAVQALQRDLRRSHPGLVARLYVRQEEAGSDPTLMETYAHPAGMGTALQREVVNAAGEMLAPWCQGPRHLEAFVLVPDANSPNTQDTQP
jgi:hypothetical protein